MMTTKLLPGIFFAILSQAHAQSPPKPPSDGQMVMPDPDECRRWRDALGGGYTLKQEEQGRFSLCITDSQSGGIAPGYKVFEYQKNYWNNWKNFLDELKGKQV